VVKIPFKNFLYLHLGSDHRRNLIICC